MNPGNEKKHKIYSQNVTADIENQFIRSSH